MKENEINEILYGRQMGTIAQSLYKFSTRGLIWPAVYGAVFGVAVFHFNTFISAFLGVIIAYLLIFPIIGIFTPLTFTALLIIAIVGSNNQGDMFWLTIASILLAIHVFRTIVMIVMVRRYPSQTRTLDMQYQLSKRYK